ncbi:MAG TPA: TfpX/TfpZ family type IV pilin accessory protein [Paucimonas sp.]|nr:TfpX/TfpZ family type IV pilin accessory protein [Paucimonas sp.]HJW56787.1 TfpX/TfpZ family type IV pilin accessory protein [Burkholderiaceae bacterium]
MKLNRFQAFGWHVLASILVGLLCSALVFLLWYPWPLPAATGVTEIFLLLLAVDVVIGPCMTLLVFNPAKKELKRDLAIVLLLQIGAFLYGLHAVFIARPVYLVFNTDRFDLVYANDFTPEKLGKVSDPRFRTVPLLGPHTVAARRPEEAKARSDILFSALSGGDDLPQLPQFYVPYPETGGQAQKQIHPLEELRRFNGSHSQEIAALAEKYAAIKGGVGFLPLRGKVKDLAVIVRKDSAEILEVANLNPWQ